MNQAAIQVPASDGLQSVIYPAQNGDRLIPVNNKDISKAYNIVISAKADPHSHMQERLIAQAEEHGRVEKEAESRHPSATGGEAASAEAHGKAEYQLPHEIPNIVTLIEAATGRIHPEHGERGEPGAHWFINPFFTLIACLLVVIVVMRGLRRPNLESPGFLQNLVEALMGGLYKFFQDVLGSAGEKFVPYIASLFLFIWFNNLIGLIPLCKAPTSSFFTTIALGLCTFCYVQYNAIKEGGFKNWFMHLLGQPLWLAPLNFPLHVMGELIKPISLSLRLFGNIFGEDKLLAAFLGMGMMIIAAVAHTAQPAFGVPLHLPFFFLSLLTSTIQALVFALLSAIYIVLLLPHDEGHEHDHDDVEGGKLVQDHGHIVVHDMPTSSPIAG